MPGEGVCEGPCVGIPQPEEGSGRIFTSTYYFVSIGTECYTVELTFMPGEGADERPHVGIPQPNRTTSSCDSGSIGTEHYIKDRIMLGEGADERPRVGIPQPGQKHPQLR